MTCFCCNPLILLYVWFTYVFRMDIRKNIRKTPKKVRMDIRKSYFCD